MATYVYKCCGMTKEVVASMKETHKIPMCNICNAEMIRQYDSFGIQFKGKGFYSTDGKQ